jgi:predicted Zn finger-like uncharacterized protein
MVRAVSQWVFMRIACPTCAAEYEVPASRLAPRRVVRCARCGGEWAATEEAEELPPDFFRTNTQAELAQEIGRETPEPLPPVTAMDRLAAPRPRPSWPIGLIAAWVMTLVILIAAVAATITWKESVVRAWPPSNRILGSMDHPTPAPAQTAGKAPEEPRPAKE